MESVTTHTLFITGNPRPKGSWTPFRRKNGTLGMHHSSARVAAWCREAAKQVKAQYTGPLYDCPIHTTFIFLMERGSKAAAKRKYPTSPFDGDLDKLVRGLLDSMTGVVYKDDRLVVKSSEEKIHTDGEPGVQITITTDGL